MKIKRVFAFILDMFLVMIISSAIYMLPVFKTNMNEYTNYIEDNGILSMYADGGSTDLTVEEANHISYEISKLLNPLYIIMCAITFLYFGILGYIWNGQTLAKKLFKIRVVSSTDKPLNPSLYIIREVIVTNLIFQLISVIITITLREETWINVNLYLSKVSLFVYFLLLAFMIFRSDEKGLQDLLCKTEVIEEKKEK